MSLTDSAAVLMALIALGTAWVAFRRANQLQEKVERLQATLYSTRADLRQMNEELSGRLERVDYVIKKNSGELRFNPSLRLAELYAIEPRAPSVLAPFHIGGCTDCAVDEQATLAEAARQRGADLDRVLVALNNLSPEAQPPGRRTPNVDFPI
jgi:hypothetical protein